MGKSSLVVTEIAIILAKSLMLCVLGAYKMVQYVKLPSSVDLYRNNFSEIPTPCFLLFKLLSRTWNTVAHSYLSRISKRFVERA